MILINSKNINTFSNGVSVEGANHRQVVDLIKAGGDKLELLVISAPMDEGGETSSNGGGGGYDDYGSGDNGGGGPMYRGGYDYSEKRSLPITIPTYQNVATEDEQVFYFSQKYFK